MQLHHDGNKRSAHSAAVRGVFDKNSMRIDGRSLGAKFVLGFLRRAGRATRNNLKTVSQTTANIMVQWQQQDVLRLYSRAFP